MTKEQLRRYLEADIHKTCDFLGGYNLFKTKDECETIDNVINRLIDIRDNARSIGYTNVILARGIDDEDVYPLDIIGERDTTQIERDRAIASAERFTKLLEQK